jgi:hypothetical protein
MRRFRALQPVYVDESLNVAASIITICIVALESIVGKKFIGDFFIKHE